MLRITGNANNDIFPERFTRSFDALDLEISQIPYHMCMPEDMYKESIEKLLKRSQNALETLESIGYIQTLILGQKVLLELTRSSVDESRLKRYIQESSSGPSVVSALKSFIPRGDGLCDLPEYSLTKTVTGRMVVNKGPSILTLASKYRDILKSQYENGKIVQIDFVSLEPRVCRLLSGSEAPPDIYNDISRILGSTHERKVVKLAVLCALYGISTKKLGGLLSSDSEARRVVKSIRKYFSLSELERRLKGELLTAKKIANHYGRPLVTESFDSHVLISHFIQSTAVDVALEGFHNIIKRVDGYNIKPIFLIHDAILFDVDNSGFEKLKSVAEEGVSISMGNFPVSMDVISAK